MFVDRNLPSAAGLLHALVSAQAIARPDAVAGVCDGERLTYGELEARSNRLARHLQSLGVGPEAIVGLCLERSLDLLVGVLGVLKAGGAYLPLDPDYPAERLAFMLADARAAVLVTHARAADRCPDHDGLTVDLDRDRARVDACPATAPDSKVEPHNLAYVIYTSGSTGTPKGVMIAHGGAVNMITWARTRVSPEVLARTLCSTSLNFDTSVHEFFLPLSAGGCCVIVKDILDIRSAGIQPTLIQTVPSGIMALLDQNAIPDSVLEIHLGGEAVRGDVVDSIFARTNAVRVLNLYGPTETTVWASCLEMTRQSGFEPHIGRPISNTEIYILDSRMRPAPVGVAGEIYIGGAGVARGYLNRPELTAERFVESPFRAGGRLYKTGDLAHFRPDGTIEFLGRNDNQIKIRGFRIELGEIEARLAEHAMARNAVVLARQDGTGEQRLVAYLVPKISGGADPGILRTHLKQTLPSYMIPQAFVMLDALPLTENGKINRKALPAPQDDSYARRSYEAPADFFESRLAAIWTDVLGVERISRTDNFFELGGHSLTAVQTKFLIQSHFDADVALIDIFRSGTLAELAVGIRQATSARADA